MRTRKSTRRNPRGAIVVNPRKRKTSSRKRKTATKRRNTIAVRTNRRRKTTRRTTAKRRAAPKRSNRRRTVRKTRRTTARRRNTAPKRRRRSTKAKTRVVYRYRKNSSHRRRKSVRRRRNPSAVASLKSGARKIPLVGGALASILGFLGPASFGALSVVPTSFAAKILARYFPSFDARAFYLLTGLGLAALVNSKLVPLSPALKQKLAVGLASGAGAIALHKHLTGQENDLSGEYGMLEMKNPAFGDYQYTVIPGYGDQYTTLYGDQYMPLYGGAVPNYGVIEAMYSDADLVDVYESGTDLDYGEIQAALAGPQVWQRIPRPTVVGSSGAGSRHAGIQGHQWGFLIRLIGFPKFQEIAKLPTEQRRAFIQKLRAYAAEQAQALLSNGSSTNLSGYGASLMAASSVR